MFLRWDENYDLGFSSVNGESPLTAPRYENMDFSIHGTVYTFYGLTQGKKSYIIWLLENVDVWRKQWEIGYEYEIQERRDSAPWGMPQYKKDGVRVEKS